MGTALAFFRVTRVLYVVTSDLVHTPTVALDFPTTRNSTRTLESTPRELLKLSPGDTRPMDVVAIKLLSADTRAGRARLQTTDWDAVRRGRVQTPRHRRGGPPAAQLSLF
jgi:hypothetical protein